MKGGTIYIAGVDAKTGESVGSDKPCLLCARVIKNAQIARVVGRTEDGLIHDEERRGA